MRVPVLTQRIAVHQHPHPKKGSFAQVRDLRHGGAVHTETQIDTDTDTDTDPRQAVPGTDVAYGA
eukprot:1335754-Rhodomonas_salina.1